MEPAAGFVTTLMVIIPTRPTALHIQGNKPTSRSPIKTPMCLTAATAKEKARNLDSETIAIRIAGLRLLQSVPLKCIYKIYSSQKNAVCLLPLLFP